MKTNKLTFKNHGVTVQQINQAALAAAATILDYEEEVALEYGEWKVDYPSFIKMDDCASIIDDPEYAEDGDVPDLDDLTEVRNWLRHRAKVAWEQYAPNDASEADLEAYYIM